MRNRRLYQLMSLLTEEEVTAFEHFLQSPLFQPSKRIYQFYKLWVERVQQAEDPDEVTPEMLLAESLLQPKRIDKYCSQLSSQLLEYVAFLDYKGTASAQLTHRLNALESRNASMHEITRLRTQIQKSVTGNKSSAERELQLLRLKWKALAARINARETQDLWKENFGELHQHIDTYYRLQKLQLSTASANARNIFKITEPEAAEALFIQEFEPATTDPKNSPLILAFYHCRQMLSVEDGETHFSALLSILKQHSGDFEASMAGELYGYALNFCIRKSNQGELSYRAHSATLYRDLLDNGLILNDGKISSHVLKNIVVIHCVLGETDWVRELLERFKDRMSDDYSGQAIVYNQAILAFYEEDYPAAIRILNEVVAELKEDVFYQLDARTYLWKSYFEHLDQLSLEEVDKMFRLYDSFRIFIDRNQQISETHKQQYRNFIREFRRFMVLLERETIPEDPLKQLYTEVEEMRYMANKGWFLEKMEAILQKIQ